MEEIRNYNIYICEKSEMIKAGFLCIETGEGYKTQKSEWDISNNKLVENYKIKYDRNSEYENIQSEFISENYKAYVDAKCKSNRVIASVIANEDKKKVVYKLSGKTYFCDDLFYSLGELDEIPGTYKVFTFKSRQIQEIEIKYVCNEIAELNGEKISVSRYKIEQSEEASFDIYILLDSSNKVIKLINGNIVIEYTG